MSAAHTLALRRWPSTVGAGEQGNNRMRVNAGYRYTADTPRCYDSCSRGPWFLSDLEAAVSMAGFSEWNHDNLAFVSIDELSSCVEQAKGPGDVYCKT